MLPYEKQLFYKQKQVADNLKRIGKIQLPTINSIIPCAATREYRNKLEYTFATKKFIPEETFRTLLQQNISIEAAANKPVAGFHAKGVFDKVVEINTCHLQQEPTNALRKPLQHLPCKIISLFMI